MKENRGFWVKFTIICLGIMFNINTSSFVVLINSIAGTFVPMGMTGPQVSMLITLPTLIMIPGVLLNGKLIKIFSMRSIMIVA